MGKYVPTAITYQNSGLVKDRQPFVLSDDAYQDLFNIYQWRGVLKRRPGYRLLGRLRRDISNQSEAAIAGPPPASNANQYNISDVLNSFRANEPNASLELGNFSLTIDAAGVPSTYEDNGAGTLSQTVGATRTLEPAQAITNISQAANAVIDIAGHSFVVGNKLLIQGVVGMVEINDTIVTVTGVTAGVDITVSLNTTSFTPYDSGGTAYGSWVNYDSGEVNLVFSSATDVGKSVSVTYGYYPALPCMGLPSRELNEINAEQTLAFDTRYAYNYSNTTKQFRELSAATATTWSGSDSDFFSGLNYWYTTDGEQYFWVTNYSGPTGDPIRVYDGTDWYDFTPNIDDPATSNNKMFQCRFLIPYKGHLIALATHEGQSLASSFHYPQRVRASQFGAPLTATAAGTAPTALSQWRTDQRGYGSFADCPTNEHIVSAEFVRDVLIVGFERSTWALRYTGNPVQPFVWDRINRELGSESAFSMVPFDQGVLYVGDKSINSCDGNHVTRIDEQIPDIARQINNSSDPSSSTDDCTKRVHGIRDFYERLVYWTYSDSQTNAKFPDRVLVFNYQAGNWSIWGDSFTAFGTYYPFNDRTWADLAGTTWSEATFSWQSSTLQSQVPDIIAGNQQGYVLSLLKEVNNEQSLQISDVTGGANAVNLEIIDHNLEDGDFIEVNSIIGTGNLELNGRIFQVTVEDEDNVTLSSKPRYSISPNGITQAANAVITAPGHSFSQGDHCYIDGITTGMTEINGVNGVVLSVLGNDITTDIDSSSFTAHTAGGEIQNLDAATGDQIVTARTYLGGGVVSKVMGFRARSKKFNLLSKGTKAFLGHIDFLANVTERGEVACNIYVDANDDDPINNGNDDFYNQIFSTQREQFSTLGKDQEWHRFFCPTDAQFLEYELTLNDRQMFTKGIVDSEVQVDAIIIWSESSGGRLVE